MFINIPWTLYDVIKWNTHQTLTTHSTNTSEWEKTNLFVNNTDKSWMTLMVIK